MGADLVSPPGHGARLEKSDIPEDPQHLEMGLGRFSFGVVYHGAVRVSHIATQGKSGGLFRPGRKTDCNCVIDLFHLAFFELDVEMPVRIRAAGEDKHPAGLFI